MSKNRFVFFVFLGIFFLSFFITNRSFADLSWNNDNFVNDSFWRQNPSNTEIKEAIFGNSIDNKTAYTQERSTNPCATGIINIVNVQNYSMSGLNSLPQSLAANTIYVLNSGTYITSGQINYNGNCSAVIGKGIVRFYSNIALNSGSSISAILKSNGKEFLVISDIKIDGLGDGLGNFRFDGNMTSGNSYGIYFYNTKNSSINSVSSFNNRNGIVIEIAENNVVSNSLFYNNGAYNFQIISSPQTNYFVNNQVFNGKSVGFYISNSTGQIISNSQFYNNAFQGIVFSNVKNSIVSNCMSYNNSRYGMRLQNNSSNNIINKSRFYNNNNTGVHIESGLNNKYYGSIKLFNNSSSSNANTLVGGISAGTSEDVAIANLGWEDGYIDTGLTIGYTYITNPRTNDGRDLISGTSRSTSNRSYKNRTGIEFISFTYGTGLIKQIKNTSYGIPSFGFSNLPYNTNNYIAQISFSNTNPNGFYFNNITGANLNQVYTSNIITLTGMDTGTREYVNINGRGSIFKNGVNIGTSGTGANGDQFYIQMTSSSNYYTLRSGSLIIGTTADDFVVTTMQQNIDDIPDNFSFTNITDAELNQLYTSNIVTLTGMDTQAIINVSISGWGTIFKNGVNIGTSGTGANGDQFYIQITSSSNYYTLRSGNFLANVVSSNFAVSTKQDLIFPSFSGVVSGVTYSEPISINFRDTNLSGATLNGNSYTNGTTISTEGDYIFEVSDTAGNMTGATFRISIPKTITITFDSNISTGTVIKTPVKYNKDVAYGMVYDDGLDDGYQPAYKYLMGGVVSGWNTNFVSPGLYYTDGAGNDVAFKGGYARYSVNSAFSDLHLTTPSYIKWTELKETYLDGRDILNHGRTSAAYPSSGQTYNYPDNPPGTTGLDYAYEIMKNYEYVRDRIGLSGVKLTHFILPSGDPSYTQPARDLGYKSVSAQNINNGNNGINIYPNVDLYRFQMNRKYVTSQNSDLSNILNDVNTLMSNSISPTTKLWRHAFTHGVVFTGNNNGGMDFSLWKYLMDSIASNYGKQGSDRIWFAGPQEVYEYVATKQGTNISTIVSGNQMIINLDTLSVPSDLRRKALTLLVTGTNANISSISYQNGAFTYHTENKNNGLINLEMGGYYLTDRNPDTFNLGNQSNANTGTAYNSNTISLTGMSSGLNNIIYLSGAGTLYKNGLSIGTSGTGANGDQFYVRLNSSNNTGTNITTYIKIGLQSIPYSITTTNPLVPQEALDDDIIYLPNTSSESVVNNRLVASGYRNGYGSIKNNLNTFFVGHKKISTRDSMGKILSPVIMQSTEDENKIEIQIPAGTIVKNGNDDIFVGILDTPKTISKNNDIFDDFIYAASFGSTGESINFKDSNNNPVNVTIRMPAPGRFYGEVVNVYYSQDSGLTWNQHTSTDVINIGGEPYVEIETTHLTDFLIDGGLGDGGPIRGYFMINSGATTTTSTGVTLNIYSSVAISGMRFSNDNHTRTSRQPYATTKAWFLTNGYGLKTVYSQYDRNGDGNYDIGLSDNIEYVGVGSQPPKVGEGYVSVGTTGYNTLHGSYYYKGNVTIAATVEDPDSALSGSTCEYTIDGKEWFRANFHTTFCDATVNGGPDLAIQFRIQDEGGNMGTGDVGNYYYDILAPQVSWTGNNFVEAIKGGGSSSDASKGVAVDEDGNKYIVGYFANTGYFGSKTLISNDSSEIFIAKISPAGEYLRAVKGGGDGRDAAYGVDLDNEGNVYVVGYYTYTGYFGSITLTGREDGNFNSFVAKLSSSNGEYLRVKKGGGGMAAVDTDSNGNVYVDGNFYGTGNFGAFTLTGGGGFIAKLSSNGDYLWASKAGGNIYDITSIAVDNNGNSYMVGSFGNTGIWGSITLFGSGSGDPFIAKVSATGEFLRAAKGGGVGKDYAYGAAVDASGNSYMVGSFDSNGTGVFGSTTFPDTNMREIFVSKLSPTGDFLWTVASDGITSYSNEARGIVLDGNGDIYIAGNFGGGSVNFGSLTLTSNNNTDAFLAKLSAEGEFLRATKGGGNSSDYAYGVAVDESGNSYMAGYFKDTASFGPINLSSEGYTDAFVAKRSEVAGSGLFTINNDAIYTTGIDVTLNINCPIDVGIGGELISYGNSTGAGYGEWTECDETKSWKLESGDGEKIVYMRTKDALGNISEDYSDTIILDTSSPVVDQAYIYSGTTGYNSPNNYYKGIVDIRGDVSDNIGLDTGTCMYTLNGNNRYSALYSGTSTTGYCYKTGSNPQTDISIRFRIQDIVNNLRTGVTGEYVYDTTAPTNVTLISPISSTIFDTGTVNLIRSASTDTGIGMSGYFYQISTNIEFSNLIMSGFLTDTGIILLNLTNNAYYRRIYAYDSFNNTSNRSEIRNFNILIDNGYPTVSTGYISVGITGTNNSSTLYYKGPIDIKADVSDILGLNQSSCEYSINNGSSWSAALYNGNSTAGYCYVNSLTPGANVNIIFRIQDTSNNLTTGGVGQYIYDATGPGVGTFTINNNAGYTNTGIVNINISSCPVDGGIGLSGIYIGNTPNPTTNFYLGCPSTITGRQLEGGDGTRTVYIKGVDKLGNTGSDFTDYIYVDSANGQNIANFTINNYNPSTTTSGVTLNISTTPLAEMMRFSNDGSNWSTRESYNTSRSWTLPGTFGSKTVYAQFDFGGGNIVDTNDTIQYIDGSNNGGGCNFVGGSVSLNGSSGSGCLVLEILSGALTCTYTPDIYVGATGASFSTQVIQGDFTGSSYDFECTDLLGSDPTRSLQIMVDDDLVNSSNSSYTIPANGVRFMSDAADDTMGACAVNLGTNSWTVIQTAQTILGKNNDQGAICQVSVDDAKIKVDIPAHTPVGNYTSEITYTLV